jgi:branched-chain amino acid transport system permease protein
MPSRLRTYWASALIVIVLVALWPLLGESDLGILAVAVAYAIAAIGVDMATGYAGQPNFGQSAFMAIGAYTTTWLQSAHGFDLLEAFVCAIVLCAVVALILGAGAVRLDHLGFGIVTFTFAFVVAIWSQGDTLSDITGGANGVPAPTGSLFGFDVLSPRSFYGACLVVLVVGVAIAHLLVLSRSGRAMVTVKGDQRVAEVLGVNPVAVKLRAFAISAAFGGAGGALIGISAGFVTPASFPPTVSVTVFGMVALGGVGTIAGPMLGAMFFWLIPNYLPGLESRQTVFTAAVFLLVLVVLPAGLYGAASDGLRTRRAR